MSMGHAQTPEVSSAELDERTRQAVHELQGVIAERYPTSTFPLARSPEDASTIHLLVVADVDDPDDVGDLVVDRVVSLQVDEGIPLHVIPLRMLERVSQDVNTEWSAGRQARAVRLFAESA